MAHDAFCSPLIGAPWCAAKPWHWKKWRWMHLGAKEVMTRHYVQRCWAQHSVSAMSALLPCRLHVGSSGYIWWTYSGRNAVDNRLFDYSWWLLCTTHPSVAVVGYSHLCDIPPAEWLYKREICPRVHLHLGNLQNEVANKMTGFSIAELHLLFQHFGLWDFVHANFEVYLHCDSG